MNSLVTTQFDLLHESTALRDDMMALLSDDDLAFQPPGNPTLGELCREIGEIEQSYIESFRTFQQDFSYCHPETEIATSVTRLQAWYQQLDSDLEAALSAFSEEDIQGKMINRGWMIPVTTQFHIYREALLIFYAKASVYLKTLGKPFSEQWRGWIG